MENLMWFLICEKCYIFYRETRFERKKNFHFAFADIFVTKKQLKVNRSICYASVRLFYLELFEMESLKIFFHVFSGKIEIWIPDYAAYVTITTQ